MLPGHDTLHCWHSKCSIYAPVLQMCQQIVNDPLTMQMHSNSVHCVLPCLQILAAGMYIGLRVLRMLK